MQAASYTVGERVRYERGPRADGQRFHPATVLAVRERRVVIAWRHPDDGRHVRSSVRPYRVHPWSAPLP